MMDIFEITTEEYDNLMPDDIPVYVRRDFLELNAYKVEKIHYLLGSDKKKRALFAIGEKDNVWLAPFSAPFSNIVFLREDVSVDCIWDFVQAFTQYAVDNGAKQISMYLPPDIYGAEINAKVSNALLGARWSVSYQDINYSLDLEAIEPDSYSAMMHHNARKNLRIALASQLSLVNCETPEEKETAYNIIAENRHNKGYPLRMTKQQLMDTIRIVDHDFFLVYHEEHPIAAAVVYHVTKDIAQVIYWGDIADVGEYKPINYLSYRLIEYYKQRYFRILDIGPSTEEGRPNFGLCNFKESIGCVASSKFKYCYVI